MAEAVDLMRFARGLRLLVVIEARHRRCEVLRLTQGGEVIFGSQTAHHRLFDLRDMGARLTSLHFLDDFVQIKLHHLVAVGNRRHKRSRLPLHFGRAHEHLIGPRGGDVAHAIRTVAQDFL